LVISFIILIAALILPQSFIGLLEQRTWMPCTTLLFIEHVGKPHHKNRRDYL
jgi:hypothetical protein